MARISDALRGSASTLASATFRCRRAACWLSVRLRGRSSTLPSTPVCALKRRRRDDAVGSRERSSRQDDARTGRRQPPAQDAQRDQRQEKGEVIPDGKLVPQADVNGDESNQKDRTQNDG